MHRISLQQSCPSISVFCEAIALNISSNSIILDSKFNDKEFSLFVLKTIPRQLALFVFKENSLCFINLIVFDVREPKIKPFWHTLF